MKTITITIRVPDDADFDQVAQWNQTVQACITAGSHNLSYTDDGYCNGCGNLPRELWAKPQFPQFNVTPVRRPKVEPLITPRGKIKLGFWRRLRNFIRHGDPYKS